MSTGQGAAKHGLAGSGQMDSRLSFSSPLAFHGSTCISPGAKFQVRAGQCSGVGGGGGNCQKPLVFPISGSGAQNPHQLPIWESDRAPHSPSFTLTANQSIHHQALLISTPKPFSHLSHSVLFITTTPIIKYQQCYLSFTKR